MPLSYRAKLRLDLSRWQELGLIRPDQVERISAEALAPRGLRHLQAALVLCILLLVAPSIIAFVAANWSAMSPLSRMVVLLLGNAATVLVTYLAVRRHGLNPAGSSRRLADGMATLSLAFAAAALALVGQTFHVALDPRGFAGALALMGLATAFVARSGGAALIACLALAAADTGLSGVFSSGIESAHPGWAGFWIVGPALFLASLAGWLPAREATLLLLLVILTNHLSGSSAGLPYLVSPDLILMVAAVTLALGHVLAEAQGVSSSGAGKGRWATPLRDGGEALRNAAGGLFLLGILTIALRTLGLGGTQPGLMIVPAFAALASAALLLTRRRLDGHGTLPLTDLVVLAAAALGLLAWLVCGATGNASPSWTVWGGIVPALGLVVAGHIGDRRGLFVWGLTLCGGLTLGMLAASRNLIAFSGNLLVCAFLLAMTLAACRWADRRLTRRSA
jgi:hypothetical protein